MGMPRSEQASDRGEQAHRHDQDDRQRKLPAFVLRDEDEEDEESGGAEDEKSRRAALLLLESEVGPLESNALAAELGGQAPPCDAMPYRWRYPVPLPPAPRRQEKDCSVARGRGSFCS